MLKRSTSIELRPIQPEARTLRYRSSREVEERGKGPALPRDERGSISIEPNITKARRRLDHDGNGSAIHYTPRHGWTCRNRTWRSTDGSRSPFEPRCTWWTAPWRIDGPTDASGHCWTRRSAGYSGRSYDGNDARWWTSRRCFWTDAQCTRLATPESTTSPQSDVCRAADTTSK